MKAIAPVDKFIFGLVLLIIVVAPTQYAFQVAGTVNLSIVDPLVWLTAGLYAMRMLVSRSFKTLTWPPLMAILLLFWGALTVFNADSLMDAVKDLFQYAEYFIAGMLIFAWFARDPSRRRLMVNTFLAAATVVVIVAVVQYFMRGVPAFEVRGTFGNRNVLGGFLSMVVPLAFAIMLHEPGIRRRVWLGVLALAGLLVTLAGGSLLAILIAAAVVAMLHAPRVFLVYAVGVVLFLGLAAPRLPRDNVETALASITVFDDDAEPVQRYPEWQAGIYMALDNPWLGVGIGNYQRNIGLYYGILPSENEKSEADSQNLYLVIASSLGLLGLLFFAGLLLRFGRAALLAWSDAADPGERGLALGLTGAAIGFSINALWAPLLVRGIGLPLVLLIALAMALRPAQKEAET